MGNWVGDFSWIIIKIKIGGVKNVVVQGAWRQKFLLLEGSIKISWSNTTLL